MTNSSPTARMHVGLSFFLAGCGTGGDTRSNRVVSRPRRQDPKSTFRRCLLANADVERGKMMYLQCRACHSLEGRGSFTRSGPNLYGMFDSKAAFAEGFTYSDVDGPNADVVWTPETLDPWLRPSQPVYSRYSNGVRRHQKATADRAERDRVSCRRRPRPARTETHGGLRFGT